MFSSIARAAAIALALCASVAARAQVFTTTHDQRSISDSVSLTVGADSPSHTDFDNPSNFDNYAHAFSPSLSSGPNSASASTFQSSIASGSTLFAMGSVQGHLHFENANASGAASAGSNYFVSFTITQTTHYHLIGEVIGDNAVIEIVDSTNTPIVAHSGFEGFDGGGDLEPGAYSLVCAASVNLAPAPGAFSDLFDSSRFTCSLSLGGAPLNIFNFPSFALPNTMAPEGDALAALPLQDPADTALHLSPTNIGFVSGTSAAWNLQGPAELANGFDTTFTFQIDAPGGDGLAFVIQSDFPFDTGESGSGIGYAGIPSSLAVEIDTFNFTGEFPTPHVSIQSLGADPNSSDDSASLAHADLPADSVTDNLPHTVRVHYTPPPTPPVDGGTGAMDVYYDGNLVLSANLDLANINGGSVLADDGSAYLGFTAGTGAATQSHDILSWSFNNGVITDCATDFTLPAIDTSTPITTVGSALLEDGDLLLTPDDNGQAGAAWLSHTAHLADGFDTSFNFVINSFGADGMALVIQNNGLDQLGDSGSGLGYAGIPAALAVEIDTFGFEGEFPTPHVSVQTSGLDPLSSDDSASLAHASFLEGAPPNDGQQHTLRVRYDAQAHQLTVFYDNAPAPLLSAAVNLTDIDGQGDTLLNDSGCAYIGFTAATGGVTEAHLVTAWTFTNTLTPLSLACNPADIVSVGQQPPPDGLLTGDDYVAFINAFFTGQLLADIVSVGQQPPPDGLLTGDDYVAFINAFFVGCH